MKVTLEYGVNESERPTCSQVESVCVIKLSVFNEIMVITNKFVTASGEKHFCTHSHSRTVTQSHSIFLRFSSLYRTNLQTISLHCLCCKEKRYSCLRSENTRNTSSCDYYRVAAQSKLDREPNPMKNSSPSNKNRFARDSNFATTHITLAK